MNFVSKFDAKLPPDGSVAHSHVHVEHPSAHMPADAIVVPDAHLLFGADFKRAGVDLILSNADRELVVHDYFKGEHRLPLASPDGAHLTGDIVNALTGQVQYAQAGAPDAAAHVIGHVTKLTGSATAIRNGVSIILNQGENVEKGDVVATGSDSTLGVTFIDGTVFGLSSNARMVLNEMVYDPNGSNNSSLISLVAGTISFVAGETAKHGDMKVDTPVATMGIRGTAVLVEINFDVPGQNGLPDAKFQVLVEPDGSTGSYILFDKTTLDPIATVNKAGQQVNINQNGVSYTNSPLTPELQKLISDVFTQKFTDLNNPNTKSAFDHFTDSIVPQSFQGFKGPDGIVIQTVFVQTNALGNGPSQVQAPGANKGHVDLAPNVDASSGSTPELVGVTGSPNTDTAIGSITFKDVNLGDQPTASAVFHSFSYQDAQHHDISLQLTPTELAAVQAVEVALDITQDPSGLASGTAHWSYNISDAALDFLGQNETLTLTYYVTVSNNFAQSILTTTVPITITITGSNDVPKIDSAVPQTIAFLGGTNVAGGDLTAHVPTSGTILFDDPDLTDTHTVSVAPPTSTLTDPTTGIATAFTLPPTPLAIFNQALTASITDSTGTGHGSISWSLAELPVWLGDFVPNGEVLTLTYAVTVTDSQNTTATQDITVTITGTATPAVVWIATTGTGPAPDGLWSTAANWETGNAPTSSDDVIIITDQLEGLTPTYPVTITSAVGATGAAANNLAMDNFGGTAPVLINQVKLAVGTDFDINDHSTDNPEGYTGPEFDNQGGGSVTIGGAFNLNADAIVHNAGSITVTGKMEALDQSTVQNSGTLKLAGGGDFSGQSTISNTTTGALIEVAGGTLNVGVGISNLGTIKIDPSAALTLSSATINGGTVTNNGTLTLNGGAVVENGTLGNSSQLTASGSGNALDNEKVTNTGSIEIVALGALTFDLLTTVTNTGHTITVDGTEDGTGTLTLQGGASITGGNLSNSGTVNIEGTGATLDGVTVTGTGAIDVDGPAAVTALVLKDVTSITKGTLTVGPTGVLSIAGGATLDHVGITNQNSIEVTAGNTLTLDDGTSVDNTAGTVTVDGTGTLTLNGATITGGTINDFNTGGSGTIDVTGASKIDGNATLNNGNVKVESVTLTLDNVTVSGSTITEETSGSLIQIDGTDRLTLEGGATIQGAPSVQGAISNAGTVEVAGAAELLDVTLTNTTSGIVQVDGGDTLTLNGVTITGGTINDSNSGGSGTIDVTGASKVTGSATLNGGNVTVESVTLTLDNATVSGSTITEEASGSLIQIDGTDRLTLEGGATIQGAPSVQGAISNAGTVEVAGAATLLDVTLTNTTSGIVQIDGGDTLTLNGATITGGTINNSSSGGNGAIDVTGASKITGSATLNGGNVTVESVTLTLDNVTVSGSTITEEATGSSIQIDGTDRLTLEGGATIQGAPSVQGAISNAGTVEVAGAATLFDATLTNTTSGIVQVDGGDTLTLNGAEITGGIINDFNTAGSGTIDVTGASKIDGNATLNGGNVKVESVTLTLDNVTVSGSTITEETSGSLIQIDGTHTLTLEGSATVEGGSGVPGAIGNAGTVEVAGAATLLDVTLTNTASGIVQIDGGDTLTLNGATITGGTINDSNTGGSGTIDVTGASTISTAHLNNGNVTLSSNVTLTLTNDTVAGTSFTDIASGATIQIVGNTILDDVTISGGAVTNSFNNAGTTITVDNGETLTLQDGAIVSGGTINNSGTLDIESSTGSTLNGVTITGGGVIEVDPGVPPVTTTPLVLEGGTSITGGTLTVGATSGSLAIKTAAGATLDHVGVTNDKSIEVFAGSNLTLDDGTTVANGSGTLTIDGTGTLTLNGAEITGGTINDFNTGGSGTIDVTGASKIDGNAALNNGNVKVESATLTLDNVTVSGSTITEEASGSSIQIDGTDRLTLEGGATIQGAPTVQGAISNAGTIEAAGAATLLDVTLTNTTSGIVQVDGGDTLTLNGATITGGTINDFNTGGSGTIDVTGASKITGSATLNGGNVTVESVTLTLDNATVSGSTITEEASGSLIQIDGTDRLTLEGGATIQGGSGVQGAISNAGTVEVAGAATLLDVTLTNTTSGIVQIDGGDTLTLNGATITGGTINDFNAAGSGTIDVTGASKITGNATLNGGNVKVESVTLTLDNVTVSGSTITEEATGSLIQVDGTDKLTLEGGATIQGGSSVLGAIGNAGTIEVAGAATLFDATLTNTTSGIVQVDGGDTLTLNGATITGGTINDFNTGGNGTIDVTGASKITGSATLNSGNVTVESATLTLDDVTVSGSTITEETSGSLIQIDGTHTLTLEGSATVEGGSGVPGAIGNAGTVEVAGAATLLDVTLTNTASGIVQVDGGDTLTLNNSTITGGTINDSNTGGSGTIDVTGESTISNAHLNNGDVTLGGNATLTLDGSTITGTSFDDNASGATIQVDGAVGDTVALSGVNIAGGGLNVAAHGLVQTSGNVTLTNTAVTNDGTIEVTGGKLTITGTGSVADSDGHTGGTIQIDGGAVLDLNVADTENVSFSGSGGELKIDTASFGGNIVGLAAGDEIDLSTIGYGPGTTATYVSNANHTGGTLTVTDGAHSIALQLVGDYTNAHFAGSADKSGDLLITLNANDDAPAFTPGTTTPSATVAEIANVTGSSATDDSTPTGGAIHFTDIDLTDRPTATVAQTVTWTGGTLTGGEQSALEGGFQLTPVTNTNNGEIDWTYGITDSSLDFLGAGQTATVTSTITLDDHQNGHDTATVTVTISGANDVPTIAATGGSLNEASNITGNGATDTTGGTITFTDADVTDRPTVTTSFSSFDYKDAHGNDLTQTLTQAQQAEVVALETALTLSPGANTNNGTVGWSYSVIDSALDFMAAGDQLVLTYNATVNDGHGGTASTPVTVTINGADDLPSISGVTTGAVADGGVSDVSGVLTASDPDRGDSVTWSVVGGTSVAPENYNYGLEDLKVTKGGTTIFHDTFTGTAPPAGPNFAGDSNGTNAVYAVSGGTFVPGSTATQLEGADAAPVGISLNPATYGDVVFGQFTTLLTGTSFNSVPGTGLRSGEAFTASAVFDLDNPADSTTHYGLRLSDRVNGSTGGTNDQPGTETVDLHVVHNADGTMSVQLNEIDFETGTTTNLQTIAIATGLTPGITDNAIQLNLSNAVVTNGHITASFQLFGTNGGAEVADGGPVVFTTTGQIFDNEDWTRVQVYGQSVGTSDTAPAGVTANAVSELQGTYGTLDVNEQTGTWQYFLNPGLASVKALAAGQTAIDTFTIAATDTASGQTTQTVNVTVTGIDDAPTVAIASPSPVSVDENHTVTINGISVNDVDAGTSQIEVTLAAGHGALSLANGGGLDNLVTNSDGSINLFGSQAAIDTALSHGVIYTPATDFSGPDTLTVTANDQVSAGLGGPLTGTGTVSINVEPGTPTFSSMTLNIAQGGAEVLTDANFSISDPDTSHFLYSVNNVTGGEFYVFNGTNWVSAPTGGFTTAQIELGQVEFVQDGTAAAPNFSITAADGTNVSAPISPTVTFSEPPSVSLGTDTMTLAGTSSFGGSGEHQGAAVTFADGHLYLSYNNGPETGGTSDTADVVAFDTGSGSLTQTFTYAWGKGDFFGIAADSSHIYAVGESNPGYGLTTDSSGGVEAKSILVGFDAGGTAGSGPSAPALDDTPNNFFSYEGFESFNKVIAVDQAGEGTLYAVGAGQPNSYDAYFIAEYDTSGHLLASATDSSVGVTFSNEFSAPIPGSSGANSVVAFGGTSSSSDIWAVGYTAWPSDNGGQTNQQAVVWEYDANLNLLGRFKDTDAALTGHNASFNDAAVVGNSLYAVGYAGNSSGGQNYLIADYHSDGSIAWSESFGPAGTDVLTGAVSVDGLLFVVGSTTSGGVTEGVLMEIDASNGNVVSTVTYDPGQYNSFTSITTDGHQLYVAGVSGSSASSDQAVLLTYGLTSNNFSPDHSSNLIVNGGFETGDFSGWTVGGDGGNHAAVGGIGVPNIGDAPNHGSAEALLTDSGGDVTLSQTIATTAGEHYTVDFWLMNDATGNNNSSGDNFSATWNGAALTTLTTDPGSTYTEYQFDVVGAANATQSTLEFSAQSGVGSWALDDVSVRDGAPGTVQQVTDQTTSVTGVNSGDTLAVTPVGANTVGTVTATAGAGTADWQFSATNAQLDHLIGMTQSFTVTDQNQPGVSQAVAVSIGGAGNDQFVFAPGVGADTVVNFTMASNAQGAYVGETIALDHFSNILGVNDVLQHLSTDAHGNAVVDLGNHDSITFQGVSAAAIQANAAHIFQVLV